MKDMPKSYDHLSVEEKWYKNWEQNGYFHAAPNPDKEPFTIVIPPPNITGKLHMGHLLHTPVLSLQIIQLTLIPSW